MSSTALTSAVSAAEKFAFPLNGTIVENTTALSRIHKTATEALVEFTGTGALMGWSSSEAPQSNIGWPSSVTDHDALAKDYFIQRGISASELSQTTHFTGHSTSVDTSTPDVSHVTSLGYSTSFSRVFSGFDVVDSRASVQLNANKQAVALHLYWPDVPISTLQDARALQALLVQGWAPKAGLVGSGWQVTNTRVVIHHGLAGDAAPVWQTTIRVDLTGGTKTSYIDCDGTGGRLFVYGGTVPSPQQRL
ncbi:MAG: hypothetical protein M3O36_10240 [Myxococcota bacterium]|nr:hypothetical protein [Myxococcota bacterium]